MKLVETFFKNLLLKIVLVVGRVRKNDNKIELNSESKVLFIRLNKAGDALVCTPLIHKLKQEKKCKIYILADKKNHFTFGNNDDIEKVYIYPKKVKESWSLLSELNQMKFDAIVDLHDDVSVTGSVIFAKLTSPRKLGLKRSNSTIYTKTIERLDSSTNHVVDRMLKLGDLLGLSKNNNELNIRYTPKLESFVKVDNLLKEKFDTRKYLVGVNISAGSDARFWGTQGFSKLLNLLKEYDVNVIVITTTRDLRHTLRMPIEKNQVFYTPDFDEFAALISRLDFLFSPDTATIHIASAYNIPIFGLYVHYKTKDMIWTPYKSDYEVVVTEEPTLSNLSFEEVKEKFVPFFNKHLKK